MSIRIVLAFVLPLVFFSCKKHRLKDEKAILVGKWEWAYSVKITHFATGNSIYDTIFPTDVLDSYGVEFFKKGNVIFEENDIKKDKYRTVFRKFQITGSVPGCFMNNGDVYDFDIYLNNDESHTMEGCVSSDSLTFFQRDFPFINEYDEINETFTSLHLNVFTRVN